MTEQGSPAPEISPDLVAAVAAAMAQRQPAESPAPNGYRLGGPAPDPTVIDLDEQLARIDTTPQRVRLNGHTYSVRRDFTTEQANELLKLAQSSGDDSTAELKFWAALVGEEDAVRLQDYTATLPMPKANLVGQQLAVAAGLGAAISGALGEA